jgi:hypothetical protein
LNWRQVIPALGWSVNLPSVVLLAPCPGRRIRAPYFEDRRKQRLVEKYATVTHRSGANPNCSCEAIGHQPLQPQPFGKWQAHSHTYYAQAPSKNPWSNTWPAPTSPLSGTAAARGNKRLSGLQRLRARINYLRVPSRRVRCSFHADHVCVALLPCFDLCDVTRRLGTPISAALFARRSHRVGQCEGSAVASRRLRDRKAKPKASTPPQWRTS